MTNRYSRLESTEEKRNLRNALILLGSAFTVLILLIFYGIPLVGRVASFVSGLKNTGTSANANDKTPPAPPSFNIYPDFTNQQTITISGTAEPGASVKLTFNNKEQDTTSDKDGNFNFNGITLSEGENKFSAFALDASKNKSQPTGDKIITLDVKPPEITLENPVDGATLIGSTQRQIDIVGNTEASASVTINERVVTLNNNGRFQYPVTLNSGENSFTIKSTDPAGNSTDKNITLNYSE